MNDLATTLELQRHIRQCIQKVATGPEYSKDLSFEDAYKAMRYVLSDAADPVQVAVYLVGLRMKRETEDENRATLQAIIDHSTIVTANVPEVLDLSDPYDGYARGVPVSTFVPAILASMGIPCVLHGLAQVGSNLAQRITRFCKPQVSLHNFHQYKRLNNWKPLVGHTWIKRNLHRVCTH